MVEMKTSSIITATLFAFAFFLQPAYGSGESDGKTLFENTCGKCHSIERPKSKKKTKEEWQTTVMRMRKNGAQITDQEAKLIIDYLSATYKK